MVTSAPSLGAYGSLPILSRYHAKLLARPGASQLFGDAGITDSLSYSCDHPALFGGGESSMKLLKCIPVPRYRREGPPNTYILLHALIFLMRCKQRILLRL